MVGYERGVPDTKICFADIPDLVDTQDEDDDNEYVEIEDDDCVRATLNLNNNQANRESKE